MFLDAMMLDPSSPEQAASIAGFNPPEAAAWRLLADKRVKRALYERRQALLESVVAISAIYTMRDILQDKNVSAATRAKVSKDALDAAKHTGLAAAKIPESVDDQEIDLANMTNEELQALTHLVREAKAEVETRKRMPERIDRQNGPVKI
jgi:hypothetical protein